MKIIKTAIPDLVEIEPTVFGDSRGYFYSPYHKEEFHKNGITVDFMQDNQSKSSKGVLRGLHFQKPPFAQGKLVRVIHGSVLDVAVDIRKGSPTYGQHHSVVLTGENMKMFWVPEGFAHGFATLEDDTVFSYKCTNLYNPSSEGSVFWNDEDLNIDWGIEDPQLSGKDKIAPSFKELQTEFIFND